MRGERLREERRRRHLSLRDLEAEIGVSFNTLARIERGGDCFASAADAVDAWLGANNGVREALTAADGVLSEVGHRYGSRLPDAVHRDCLEASAECRRVIAALGETRNTTGDPQ